MMIRTSLGSAYDFPETARLRCTDCSRQTGVSINGRCRNCSIKAQTSPRPSRTATIPTDLQRKRDEEARWMAILPELEAHSKGLTLGRHYAGDPYRAASVMGFVVETVANADLQRRDKPDTWIMGRTWRIPGRTPVIQLSNALDVHQRRETLAHELGHLLDLDKGLDTTHIWSRGEKVCDAFAKAFLEGSATGARH